MDSYTHFHYIHIPKCGGTSFREHLYEASIAGGIRQEEIYIPGFNQLKTAKNYDQLNFLQKALFNRKDYKVIGMHATANVFKAKLQTTANPFVYTILRDPIERFLSHYYHFYFHQGIDGCMGIHLVDLETSKREALLKHLSNLMIKYLTNRDLKSQVLEQDLSQATRVLDTMSLFGILEKMEHSMHILSQKAPQWLSFNARISKRNEKRVGFSLDEYVDSELRQLIASYNSFDLQLYNHALAIFEQ